MRRLVNALLISAGLGAINGLVLAASTASARQEHFRRWEDEMGDGPQRLINLFL